MSRLVAVLSFWPLFWQSNTRSPATPASALWWRYPIARLPLVWCFCLLHLAGYYALSHRHLPARPTAKLGISARPLWHYTNSRTCSKRTTFFASTCLSALANKPLSHACSPLAPGLAGGCQLGFFILPLIYHQIRLPVIAVLVFSLSVVDMALLLAPSLPPPLAILVLNGFHDANLSAACQLHLARYGKLVLRWLHFCYGG